MEQAKLQKKLDDLRAFQGENETAEFKANRFEPRELGEYVSALANSAALTDSASAWLVWGVDDGSKQVTGTTFDPHAAKWKGNQSLEIGLSQHITPRPDLRFHTLDHPDGRVVMLEIQPARMSPLAFDNMRYIRVGSSKAKLSDYPDKEARLWAKLRGSSDWSHDIVASATFADLDPDALIQARALFKKYLQRNQSADVAHVDGWSDRSLLDKAKITRNGQITRSALLLLGRDTAAHLLSPADVKISWILRDSNNIDLDHQHFGPPILLAVDKAVARIRNLTLEYMPDGTLFPTPIPQYDNWVLREALHNAVAHQDYTLSGRVSLVEYPDRLVISNAGDFAPPSIAWLIRNDSTPDHYRNRWLIEGMISLTMIDQRGSGIKRMFREQRKHFMSMPEYEFPMQSGRLSVKVTISGKLSDSKYIQTLMRNPDLTLEQVCLLDRVQKQLPIAKEEAAMMKELRLIEGRRPNYFISASMADVVGDRAGYIRNRSFDDAHFEIMIYNYISKFGSAGREDIQVLLADKLSDALDRYQKYRKIGNLLQTMKIKGIIRNVGSRVAPVWVIVGHKRDTQSSKAKS